MRLARVLFLSALLATTAPAPLAQAAPMVTPFATLRARATLVALGTVRQSAGAITLDVDKVIAGKAPLGPMVVQPSPDGMVTVDGERVVAIVDGGALRWVGRMIAGSTLEDGVLQLQGFFDFNAHLVSPAVMSLSELVGALQTGKLEQTFAATLVFHDASGAAVRSTKKLTMRWDAMGQKVLGAPVLQGFTLACLGQIGSFGADWGDLRVYFHDTCPSSAPNARSRSLDLEGRFVGWNAQTRELEVDLEPDRPYLTEAELARFAGDGTLASVTHVAFVHLADGSTWKWEVGRALVDAGGKAHPAGGVSSTMQTKGGVTTTEETYGFGDASLVLSPSPGVSSPGGNARGLVPWIAAGAPTACTLRRKGRPPIACALKNAPSIFVAR